MCDNPLINFINDKKSAAMKQDPYTNLGFFSTVSSMGLPSVRTLVLRELDDYPISLFVNSTSPKWQDLFSTGKYQLLTYWASIQKQYRLSGDFEEIPSDVIQPYWNQQPYESKILDLFYIQKSQSEELLSYDWFMLNIENLKKTYPEPNKLKMPVSVKGVALYPSTIEVLELKSECKINQRRLYEFDRNHGKWSMTYLTP
jgi:pyridoxamine 5'-phosphate oxidase